MGIRDWLAIIVIIFILLILLDGFRRKWLERKSRIRVKLDKRIPPADGDDDDILVKSELPAGGARIKPRTGKQPAEDVPVLMDSVDIDSDEIEEYAADEDDWEEQGMLDEASDFDEVMAGDGDETGAGECDDEEDAAEEDSRHATAASVAEQGPVEAGKKSRGNRARHRQQDNRIEPSFGDEELTFGRDDQGALDLEHHDLFEHEEEAAGDEGDEQAPAEEVIIINVMAKQGAVIDGDRLLPVLLKQGMRLGDMSIFHRHADASGKGPVMFSMANMLKPGTFVIGEMESVTTPDVSFFMQLPNKLGNMQCFEQMLKTAVAVRDELDAVLKDENRSVFTRQTIEHSRQRIRDFELEMLARK